MNGLRTGSYVSDFEAYWKEIENLFLVSICGLWERQEKKLPLWIQHWGLRVESWETLVLGTVIDTCSCARHSSRNSVLMRIPTPHLFALDSCFYKWRYIF